MATAPAKYTKYSTYAGKLDQYAAHLRHADKNLAAGALGKAIIDCRLLTSQSKWALIGQPPDEYMTGLLFVKLQYLQPRDYTLDNATVWLEFDSPVHDEDTSHTGPYIVDHQPVHLCGQPAEHHVISSVDLNPSIDTGFGGASLGSFHKSKEYVQAYRWTFTGQTHVSEDEVLYTRVAYKWEDRSRGSELPFERPIYAAVVVRHDTKPFVINARIDGKLRSMKHAFRRWKLKPVPRPGHLVEPVDSVSAEDIQKLIQGLEQDILDENQRAKAKEMADIQSTALAV